MENAKTYTYDRLRGVLIDKSFSTIPVSHDFKERYKDLDVDPHIEGKTFRLSHQARMPYDDGFVWAVISANQYDQCKLNKRIIACPINQDWEHKFRQRFTERLMPPTIDEVIAFIKQHVTV